MYITLIPLSTFGVGGTADDDAGLFAGFLLIFFLSSKKQTHDLKGDRLFLIQ